MAEVKIRKLDPVVLKKIDELAKKHNISREEYLRGYLNKLAAMGEVEEATNKYNNLVQRVTEQLEQCAERVEINNMVLNTVLEKLKSKEDFRGHF